MLPAKSHGTVVASSTTRDAFSIVLISRVNADYKFVWIDIGGQEHMSVAQIFDESELKECLGDKSISRPPADLLPHDDWDKPYFFLDDDAFWLRTYMMKPY